MTNQQQPTWLGLRVEDCLIEELIGEGSYSWVYKGRKLDGSGYRAFKCAKPEEFVERAANAARTQCKGFFTGGACDIRPDAHFLLVAQARKLQEVTDVGIVSADVICADEGLAYYEMEFVDGASLDSLPQLLNLCTVMHRLSADESFKYHGDLKPANILVPKSGNEVILVDPGYFGPLDSDRGQFARAAVTTPFYYPFLTPDDQLAIGIMAWELLLGRNPFLLFSTEETKPTAIERSSRLQQHVKVHSISGNFNLEPLLGLPMPTELSPSLTQEQEDVLLKAIKLQRNQENQLDLNDGFTSFNELRYNLERAYGGN